MERWPLAEPVTGEVLGLAAFAKRIGVEPSYITQLKRDGRLVLTPDGKRVQVAASIRLIADTRDPAKAGVAARHAAARGPGAGAGAGAAAPPEADSGPDSPPAADPVADALATRRARAQAEREEAGARKALRDELVELGQLVPTDQVTEVLADATTTLRTSLENLPDTLAPQLAAEGDEDRVRVMLADALEHALEELARRFAIIGKAATG